MEDKMSEELSRLLSTEPKKEILDMVDDETQTFNIDIVIDNVAEYLSENLAVYSETQEYRQGEVLGGYLETAFQELSRSRDRLFLVGEQFDFRRRIENLNFRNYTEAEEHFLEYLKGENSFYNAEGDFMEGLESQFPDTARNPESELTRRS